MKAFKCGSTGLYFPEDYMDEWGRKYGIGLGPTPVSECWESLYYNPVAMPSQDTPSLDCCGHPVQVCMAPVFPVEVSKEEYEANKAILHRDDPKGIQRWNIVRGKQIKNEKGRIQVALAGKA